MATRLLQLYHKYSMAGALLSPGSMHRQQQDASKRLVAAPDLPLDTKLGLYAENCADATRYFSSAEKAKKL